MAMKDWMFPLLALGGLGVVAYFAFPQLFGGKIIEKSKSKKVTPDEIIEESKVVRELPDYPGGYGDLYKQRFGERPPVKKLPVVDVSDLIDRRGIDDDDDAYIITDKDFKLFDINRKERDLLNRKYRIKQPTLSKVIYGDKGDRPYIIPYYDGYSYYVGGNPMGVQPELGRLNNEQQSSSNDRKNSINLYA